MSSDSKRSDDLDRMTQKPGSVRRELQEARKIIKHAVIPEESDRLGALRQWSDAAARSIGRDPREWIGFEFDLIPGGGMLVSGRVGKHGKVDSVLVDRCTSCHDSKAIIAAASAIIDIMMGGRREWRHRLNEGAFLESDDWQTAVRYATDALNAAYPDALGAADGGHLDER